MTRAAEIEAVKRAGKRIKTEHLDVRMAASPSLHADVSGETSVCARVGIVVPKYKRSIVERNLLRRRLRELVRTRLIPVMPTGGDVFIRPLPHAYGATFDALATDIERVVARLA